MYGNMLSQIRGAGSLGDLGVGGKRGINAGGFASVAGAEDAMSTAQQIGGIGVPLLGAVESVRQKGNPMPLASSLLMTALLLG